MTLSGIVAVVVLLLVFGVFAFAVTYAAIEVWNHVRGELK